MNANLWPALATIAALWVYVGTFIACGRARAAHGIKAPATTGHPAFERAFRVQQNTLEQLVIFLPGLWIFADTVDAKWAGIVGLVWSAARILYGWSYVRNPDSRGPGFGLAALASLILLGGGTIALARALILGV
jgi:uncharacterized MAPEG superfamily protein